MRSDKLATLWSATEDDQLRDLASTGATCEDMAAVIGRSDKGVRNRCLKLGIPRAKVDRRKPVPADFVVRATGKTFVEMRREFKAGDDAVRAWCTRFGVEPRKYIPAASPLPADFVEAAPGLTISAAMARWSKSHATIASLYTRAGISPRPGPKAVPTRKPGSGWGSTKAVERVQGDGSLASIAAHHLRRHYPNVFPAKILSGGERAKYGASNDDWIVGGRLVPPGTLVEMARAKGFAA